MAIPIIRLPVTCPVCGSIAVTGFNAAELTDAVLNSRPVRLYASCHKFPWYANDPEVQQIRESIFKASLESDYTKKPDPGT